jgi:hypothetical protein
MSQYRLTRSKRKKSKFPFIVTFLIVTLVFGTLGALNENNKLDQPQNLKYFDEIAAHRSRCDDYELVEKLSFSYYVAQTHYGGMKELRDLANEKILTPVPTICSGAGWLDTPTPTVTPTPTITPTLTVTPSPSMTRTQTPIPTLTPTPTQTPTEMPHAIQFRIESESGEAVYSSVEYQVGAMPKITVDDVNSSWEYSFVSTRGIMLRLRIADTDMGNPPSCIISIDGVVIDRKRRGENEVYVTCKATVPYP